MVPALWQKAGRESLTCHAPPAYVMRASANVAAITSVRRAAHSEAMYAKVAALIFPGYKSAK
jgi:hypothetical protein